MICLGCLWMHSCVDDITGEVNTNQPPETTIFVESGGEPLNGTESNQVIFWDGTDPDGFITGFLYTFAQNPTDDDWIWTEQRNETFRLQLNGSDTTYVFQVKAVDNSGAEDPSPAVESFPIVNSAPEISWAVGSALPDSIFTVANFVWDATDPDGDETIASIEYSLDDTSSWVAIDGTKRSLILREEDGLSPGAHSIYLRAVDVAGTRSNTIRLPENPADTWFVRAPQGRYLLIDDYLDESFTNRTPDAYYRSLMNDVLTGSGDSFTYWNIEAHYPSSVAQFTETLKLFERIIWYSDAVDPADPKFVGAQIAIPEFRRLGGKIIYTVQFASTFGSQGSPLDFSPVDSLGERFGFIANNSRYYPDPAFGQTFPGLPALPELSTEVFVLGLIALAPKITSVPMYRYDLANSPATDPLFIMAGRNDNTGEYDFIFSGTPLHLLNGNGNLNEFFDIVLDDLFGL